MSNGLLEKKLREEVGFWHDYIQQRLPHSEHTISDRMHDALAFAQQKLASYQSDKAKGCNEKVL